MDNETTTTTTTTIATGKHLLKAEESLSQPGVSTPGLFASANVQPMEPSVLRAKRPREPSDEELAAIMVPTATSVHPFRGREKQKRATTHTSREREIEHAREGPISANDDALGDESSVSSALIKSVKAFIYYHRSFSSRGGGERAHGAGRRARERYSFQLDRRRRRSSIHFGWIDALFKFPA